MAQINIIEVPNGKALVLHGLTEAEHEAESTEAYMESWIGFGTDIGTNIGLITTLHFDNLSDSVSKDEYNELVDEFNDQAQIIDNLRRMHQEGLAHDHETIAALRAELEQADNEAPEAVRTVSELQARNENQASSIRRHRDELHAATARINEQAAKIATLERCNENQANTIEQVDAEVERLENQLDKERDEHREQVVAQANTIAQYQERTKTFANGEPIANKQIDAGDESVPDATGTSEPATTSTERLNAIWKGAIADGTAEQNWKLADWQHVAKHFADQIPEGRDVGNVWAKWLREGQAPTSWGLGDYRIVTTELANAI